MPENLDSGFIRNIMSNRVFFILKTKKQKTLVTLTRKIENSTRFQFATLSGDCPKLKHLWVYCPGHAGVKGNDRADRLMG